MALYLGIDTSNYTTSLAIIDTQGRLVVDERKILNVKTGQRGLRQSEAVFQHIKNFPDLINPVFARIDRSEIEAVAVSTKPRPISDSYMPVFQAGKTLAETIAATLQLPLIYTTHQEGHIMAGIWSCGQEMPKEFITIHLSGGTTEVLSVKLVGTQPLEFSVQKIGGTTDLHAGQFVDRVGVQMGLTFPAGPALEKLANSSHNPCTIPISVDDLKISFSGPESHAQRLLENGAEYSDVARGVEICLANTLEKLIKNLYDKTKGQFYLVVGGVASNNYIRKQLLGFSVKQDLALVFAEQQFSSDNAVGVSIIAQSGVRKGWCYDV